MSLDTYDQKPPEMVNYLSYFGWHFNKKMCDFAINNLNVEKVNKDQLDELLRKNDISIKNNVLYDYLYVYHMAKSDFWGSSLTSELQLLKFVRDYVDDTDAYDGMPFSRFYMDTVKKGIPIDWEEML